MPIEATYLTPIIQVFNMPRSLRFYRDLLGFEVVSDLGNGDNSSCVWISLKGLNLMLNDQYEPGHVPDGPPADRQRWHENTCFYFGCADVDAAYRFLREKGTDTEEPKVAPYGMKQLYLRDPDNYTLCFQQSLGEEAFR